MKGLVLVDIQNDFLPGGPLAVPRGDEVVPVANRLQGHVDLVVATQDWHPPDHGSFAVSHPGRSPGEKIDLHGLEQFLWPTHCVRGTRGAELAIGLETERIARVFRKGTDPAVDSYSGFFDNGRRRGTGLGEWLREQRVENLYLVGLATDYCVLYTALDGAALGFRTFVVEDGCRGIEASPGDVKRAMERMRAAGVGIVSSEALTSPSGCRP